MPEKILYIFGAGASCNALPLAKTSYNENLEIKIEGLIYALSNPGLDRPMEFVKDVINFPKMMEFQKEFKSLADDAQAFGDIDTYAMYLNILNPGGNEIKRLKKIISQFFLSNS